VRVKGPRISSLTFRSDLSWGSAYSELCKSLAEQRRRLEAVPKWETSRLKRRIDEATSGKNLWWRWHHFWLNSIESVAASQDETILNHIGMDQGVHVAGDEVVVLMDVASTIVLSNRKGLVRSFE